MTMKRSSGTRAAVALFGALVTSAALAQQPPRAEPLPDIPPPPRPAQSMDNFEPQVTIRQEGQTRYEEYRMRGRLYAVRVTPPVGRPYMLVDRTGKGTMTRMDDITGGISPPQWTLFEF